MERRKSDELAIAVMAVIIGVLLAWIFSGCCLTGDSWHENVYVPVMSGARWDGWATTRPK